jgi:hypothetical protein
MQSKENVVITGIGLISPQAMNFEELRSPPHIYEGSKDDILLPLDRFNVSDYLGSRGYKYLIPATRYLISSTKVALADAGIENDSPYLPEEKGVIVGTNFAIRSFLEEGDKILAKEGVKSIEPMEAPNMSINIPASYISIKHNFRAFNITLTSSIVAGIEALLLGAHYIQQGRAKMVLTGATEGLPPKSITELLGVPVAEGSACIFVLENLNSAIRRGANIYGVLGKGLLSFEPNLLKNNLENLKKLEADLEYILPTDINKLHLYTSDCQYKTATEINKGIISILKWKKIDVIMQKSPGSNNENISVSPLLQCAHSLSAATNCDNSLFVSSSPQGHVSLLNINRFN